jgi:hypothetical protein
MDKRKQNTSAAGGQQGNRSMPSQDRTPNKGSSSDDMRQAKMDEEKELREEASMPEDPDPVLDEQDLEENDLSTDEADRVEWDAQSKKNKNSGA